MGIMISNDSIAAASANQVSTHLNDEAVILNLSDGMYYGLNSVATRVWDMVETGRTVGEIKTLICREFDVDDERCSRDILSILSALHEHSLISIDGR